MHNLAKGIRNQTDRHTAAKCPLCPGLDNQIHFLTICCHPTLHHFRLTYRPTTDILIRQIQTAQYSPNQRWIPPLFRYIQHHIWNDDKTAADIWNGRWSPAMFRLAMGHLSDILIAKPDAQVGRNCLRKLTEKLLGVQQLIFKARRRLLHEREHRRMWRRTRQLQLQRMTHTPSIFRKPQPTNQLPTSPMITRRVPWLQKTKHPKTSKSASDHPLRTPPLIRLHTHLTPPITPVPQPTIPLASSSRSSLHSCKPFTGRT